MFLIASSAKLREAKLFFAVKASRSAFSSDQFIRTRPRNFPVHIDWCASCCAPCRQQCFATLLPNINTRLRRRRDSRINLTSRVDLATLRLWRPASYSGGVRLRIGENRDLTSAGATRRRCGRLTLQICHRSFPSAVPQFRLSKDLPWRSGAFR